MKIEIKPFDTLFFRDGKPFTMGDDNWADGIFPPPPSVIYGALRAAYFAQYPSELVKASKENDPTKDLKINDISYVAKGNHYYPVPADLAIEEKNEDKYGLYKLKMKDASSSARLKPLCAEKEVKPSSGALFTSTVLTKYLKGNLAVSIVNNKNNNVFRINEQVLTEPKIGIGRNDITKTTDSGRLYRLGMKRLQDISIIVDFEGLEIPQNGLLKFGAEGKTAAYQEPKHDFNNIDYGDIPSKKFVLYFSTPAVFKNGWYPDIFDKDLKYSCNGISVKIISAAMDKPLYIGGWDMKENKPKAMQKFVAPGTVYILETDKNILAKELSSLFSTIKMCEESYAKQGYGIFKTGVYND
jgi:CRISPR-associated protein Cmr3